MLDGMPTVEPWIPPATPDLALLAMAAADQSNRPSLRAWPRVAKGGIVWENLPPFLAWRGQVDGRWALVLLQAREVGALVPGSRTSPLPPGWLEAIDLESLGPPLARHPAFPGGTSVHVVHLPGGPSCRVRSFGTGAPEVVEAVLRRISSIQNWNLTD